MTFKAAKSNETQTGFTKTELVLFKRIFDEKLDETIPPFLFHIWDEKLIKVHALPDLRADKLQLYGTGSLTGSTIIPIDEYADWLNLPGDEPEEIIRTVETLAEQAAQSYAWNVRNAYIKGGRLRGVVGRLHISDWKNEFKMTLIRNVPVIDPENPTLKGWVAYRYRFVAAKF
jgi:hypothetical protein